MNHEQKPFIGQSEEIARLAIANTVEIVTATASRFPTMQHSDVPKFIADVHAAVSALYSGTPQAAAVEAKLEPAVPVRKRFTDTHVICLEDGKAFKSMRRHLRSLGISPEDYRAKWGLPKDDPIVHPSYSAKRSELAKANGLGRK